MRGRDLLLAVAELGVVLLDGDPLRVERRRPARRRSPARSSSRSSRSTARCRPGRSATPPCARARTRSRTPRGTPARARPAGAPCASGSRAGRRRRACRRAPGDRSARRPSRARTGSARKVDVSGSRRNSPTGPRSSIGCSWSSAVHRLHRTGHADAAREPPLEPVAPGGLGANRPVIAAPEKADEPQLGVVGLAHDLLQIHGATLWRNVAAATRVPAGGRGGGIVHARRAAAGRLPARSVAPGPGAGAQRRPAAARARGAGRVPDADGAGVRPARRVRAAAGGAGAAVAAPRGRPSCGSRRCTRSPSASCRRRSAPGARATPAAASRCSSTRTSRSSPSRCAAAWPTWRSARGRRAGTTTCACSARRTSWSCSPSGPASRSSLASSPTARGCSTRYDNSLTPVVEQACADAGFSPRAAVRTHHTATAVRLAAAGLGPALAPASMISEAAGGAVAWPDPPVRRELCAFGPAAMTATLVDELERRVRGGRRDGERVRSRGERGARAARRGGGAAARAGRRPSTASRARPVGR